MKIAFTFKGSVAENWKFTNPKDELLIYATNPFKIGLGFKRRKINTKETFKGDYVDSETCFIDKDKSYNEAEAIFYRFWRHPITKKFMNVYNSTPIQLATRSVSEQKK